MEWYSDLSYRPAQISWELFLSLLDVITRAHFHTRSTCSTTALPLTREKGFNFQFTFTGSLFLWKITLSYKKGKYFHLSVNSHSDFCGPLSCFVVNSDFAPFCASRLLSSWCLDGCWTSQTGSFATCRMDKQKQLRPKITHRYYRCTKNLNSDLSDPKEKNHWMIFFLHLVNGGSVNR